MNDDTRKKLIATSRDMLDRLNSGPKSAADSALEIPATEYTSESLHQRELTQLFRRVPLLAAAKAELAKPSSYKTVTLAGVPVLLVHGGDGVYRGFVNACTHRGSPLKQDCGHASRFTCPYHGWTFNDQGALIGIAANDKFGEVDKESLGLVELPVDEHAGLLWVTLEQQASINTKSFLGEMGEMLEGFNLADWHFHHRVALPGANWKLAFDAHLEFYHLPVLHRDTFGVNISNEAQYYFFGPHQRIGLMSENPLDPQYAEFKGLATQPEEDWDTAPMLFGEWIVFPNISINCFAAETRVLVISQVIPETQYDRSTTIQTYLVEDALEGLPHPGVDEIVAFVQNVVEKEDLPMSFSQQRTLLSGHLKRVVAGRNEAGLQQHYYWRHKIMSANDTTSLDALFCDK